MLYYQIKLKPKKDKLIREIDLNRYGIAEVIFDIKEQRGLRITLEEPHEFRNKEKYLEYLGDIKRLFDAIERMPVWMQDEYVGIAVNSNLNNLICRAEHELNCYSEAERRGEDVSCRKIYCGANYVY